MALNGQIQGRSDCEAIYVLMELGHVLLLTTNMKAYMRSSMTLETLYGEFNDTITMITVTLKCQIQDHLDLGVAIFVCSAYICC